MPFSSSVALARRNISRLTAAQSPVLIQYCSVHSDRVDGVFATLSYIDAVNHARRATAPALFSVGLIDEVTPASTVFAAHNHYAGEKAIEVYPFNGHEGGGTRHRLAQLAWLEGVQAVV